MFLVALLHFCSEPILSVLQEARKLRDGQLCLLHMLQGERKSGRGGWLFVSCVDSLVLLTRSRSVWACAVWQVLLWWQARLRAERGG